MNLFNLMARISLDDKDYNEKMNKAGSSGDKLGKSSDGLGKKMLSVGNIIKGVAVGAVGIFAKSCVDAAAALEQTNKKTDVIFGDMSQQAKDWALENERTFGAGSGTIQGYLNKISDLTQGMGMAKDTSLDLAKGATELGVQLANWNGIDSSAAIDDITRAMSGSTEAVEKYGIKLNENVLKQTAMKMGLGDNIQALSESDKALVRYQAILDSSANAVDYWNDGNRSMSFYLNEAKEQFGNIKETLGNLLLPAVKKGTEMFADFTVKLNEFTTKTVEGFGIFKTTLEETGNPTQAFAEMFKTMFGVEMPESALNMVNSIVEYFQQLWSIVMDIWETVAVPIIDVIKEVFTGVATHSDEIFTAISDYFNAAMIVIKTIWDSVGKPVMDLIMSVLGIVRDYFSQKMPEIKEFFSQAVSDMVNIWNNNLKPMFDAIKNFIVNVLAPAFEFVFKNIILPVVDSVFNGISQLWNGTLKPVFTGIIDFITGVFSGDWSKAWSGVVGIFDGIMSGLGTVIKAPLNAVIALINRAIQGLNTISVSIPDWVPFVGGNSYGINLPTIGYLEEGGILTEPTMLNSNFMAGEKNKGRQAQAEAVIPLDRLFGELNSMFGNKEVVINIDGREFMRAVAPYKEELDEYDMRYSFA